MRSTRWIAALALGSALLVTACDGDEETGPTPETFTATLTPGNERPNPITTSTATGTSTTTINVAGDAVNYTLSVTGLSAGATNAHIHYGVQTAVGTAPPAGNVIIGLNFTSAATSFSTNGTITASSFPSGSAWNMQRLISAIRNDSAYVNVHSSTNPGGEVRGQLDK